MHLQQDDSTCSYLGGIVCPPGKTIRAKHRTEISLHLNPIWAALLRPTHPQANSLPLWPTLVTSCWATPLPFSCGGNAGSQWSLGELYLGSLAWCDCGKAWRSGSGFDVIKGPGRLGSGGRGVWVVWNVGSSPMSNDPLSAGNCCLGLCSRLCAFQEPAVMIKVALNLAIP